MTLIPSGRANKNLKCKHCEYLDRFREDLSIFYCTQLRDNRTHNKMAKRKANDMACIKFKLKEKE